MNFISLLAVYSFLGYKNAVEACYEEKLRKHGGKLHKIVTMPLKGVLVLYLSLGENCL